MQQTNNSSTPHCYEGALLLANYTLEFEHIPF
jgi:hypothetical protein